MLTNRVTEDLRVSKDSLDDGSYLLGYTQCIMLSWVPKGGSAREQHFFCHMENANS